MMQRRVTGAALAAATLILAACDPPGSTGPGAVSEGEAEALQDAAEMLEERRLPEGALPPIGPPNGAAAAPAVSTETDEPSEDSTQ